MGIVADAGAEDGPSGLASFGLTPLFPAFVPAKSLTKEEAKTHFGSLAIWVAGDGQASSEWTRATLGWQPMQIGIVHDIERPNYSA